MICLVQLLHYEAQEYCKKKHILKCDECPFREECAEGVKRRERDGKDSDKINSGSSRRHL